MTTSERNRELAPLWIASWIKMDMQWLRQHLVSAGLHRSGHPRTAT